MKHTTGSTGRIHSTQNGNGQHRTHSDHQNSLQGNISHQVRKLWGFGLPKQQAIHLSYHSFERGCWLLLLP